MAKKNRERIPVGAPQADKKPFNAAFAGLAALRDKLPDAPTPDKPVAEAAVGPPPSAPKSGPKIVVRREKKGRGGKTVTRVSQLDLPAAELAELADTLKRNMGCGGGVEDGDVILFGDQTNRTAEWLGKKLSRRVVIGN